ncbi:cytochrome P450 [Streptomyces sp. NBC_00019]|uniref:cytochrome P450 n=1 Tax=Streptomyces sp. NBC_00019 TaxID=2975623 RepID=UPI002F90F5AA
MAGPVRYGHAPGSLPLIGHVHRLLLDPLTFLSSLPEHGDLVRVHVGATPTVVVCDPALARQVLLEDRTFDKNDPLLINLREVLGNGLATCPHAAHRRQRRLIQPAFHRDRLARYAATMARHISETVDSWQEGQDIDVADTMTHLTTRVAMATMLTDRLPPDQADQLAEDLSATMTVGLIRSVIPRPLLLLPVPANRRFAQAQARIRRTVGALITAARKDSVDHGDLLSMLLLPDAEHQDAFNDTEIADQISTFFFAGIETTANLLSSTLHLITGSPTWQQRMRDEIQHTADGADLDLARLDELATTHQVLTETLRLFPPVWMTPRMTAVDTELGGHRIAAGTRVIVSAHQLHRVDRNYPAAEDFAPDRWAARKPPRDGYFPYGGGARKCIGDEFGHTQAVITLATILNRWHLEPIEGPRIGRDCRDAGRPLGLRLRVTPARGSAPAPPPATTTQPTATSGETTHPRRSNAHHA